MVAVNGEVVVASPRRRVRRRFSLRLNVVYGTDEVLDCVGVVSETRSIADSWTCPILRAEVSNTLCEGDKTGAFAMSNAVRYSFRHFND